MKLLMHGSGDAKSHIFPGKTADYELMLAWRWRQWTATCNVWIKKAYKSQQA